MIIAKIVQKGQIITLEDVMATFQYSANLKMQFVIDESYKDCIITGWYRKFWKKEEKYLLDMQEDGTFLLGQDVFENDGTVEFSFALNYPDGKIVHLGVVEYYVKKSFGNGDAILPEETETWISVVSRVVKDQMSDNWDKDYKPQLEENLNIIEDKTSEIISAAEKVKQDALESSTNARNALESANLAKNSADSAKEAEEKALEHMSNAEKFKNSASSFAEQADLAKNSALESATNASNSASSALTNANKAKEHLDSVNTAVSDFNTDYTEKINEFNTNYTTKKEAFDTTVNSANTALNATITEANTSINSKVAEASAQANIAKQEADRATLATDGKLDKNQGTDNAGKAMVVDEEGNIIPGEAGINNDEVNALIDSAIKEKLYTQSEVDYLLRDKMDKPYVDVTIDSDTMVDCTMDGNFKINAIKGNVCQNVETDIVPTPSRPVSIVNKKVKANGEYVELRSLKETGNLWDDVLAIEGYIEGNTGLIASASKVRNELVCDFIPLNTSTQLSIYINVTPILNDDNNDNRAWYGVGFYDNDKKFISRQSEHSDNTVENITMTRIISIPANAKYFKFSYRSYLDGKVSVLLGNINITSYIPPTVRDYKIVDHTQKKAWIERNVGLQTYNGGRSFNDWKESEYRLIFGIADRKPLQELGTPNVMCNIAIPSAKSLNLKDVLWEMGNTNLYWYPNIYSLGLTGKETKEEANVKLNKYLAETPLKIQYELSTAVIEEIEYSESDTTEVGCSFQDTTSPSPTIPSEIISCTPPTNNLFDINFVEKWKNYTDGMSVENGVVRISNTDGYLNPRKTVAITIDKSATYCLQFDFNVIAGNAAYGNIALINYVNDNPIAFGNGSAKWLDAGKYYLLFYQGIKNTEENNIVEYSNIMLFENKKNLTEFEPYGKYSLDIKTCGKNLLNAGVASGYRKNCTVEVENGIITMTPLTADADTYLNTLNDKGSPYDKNCGTLIDVSNVKKVTVTISNEIFNKNYAALYDENLTIIMLYSFIDQNIFTIDLSKYNNAKYMTVRIGNGAMPAGSHSTTVQIEAGDTATEYQPYQESAVKLFLDEPLLSSSDKLIRDTINAVDGKLNKKIIFYKFTGTETFQHDYEAQKGYYGRFFVLQDIYINPSIFIELKCNILPWARQSWNLNQEGFAQNANQVHLKFSNKRLGISDDTPIEQKRVAFDNYVKELKTPIIFTLILKEAEITPLEPEVIDKLKQLRTFSPVTYVFVEGEVKPIYNCRYPKDLLLSQQKLESTVLTLQEEVVKNV